MGTRKKEVRKTEKCAMNQVRKGETNALEILKIVIIVVLLFKKNERSDISSSRIDNSTRMSECKIAQPTHQCMYGIQVIKVRPQGKIKK